MYLPLEMPSPPMTMRRLLERSRVAKTSSHLSVRQGLDRILKQTFELRWSISEPDLSSFEAGDDQIRGEVLKSNKAWTKAILSRH